MEALLVGVVLALISGLAWLSYHHSKFASKVLLGMIVCTLLAQLGSNIYSFGINDTKSFYDRSIASNNSLADSLNENMNMANSRDSLLAGKIIHENNKRYRERLDIAINSRDNDSAEFSRMSRYLIIIAYIILGALLGFSIIIPRYKQLQ